MHRGGERAGSFFGARRRFSISLTNRMYSCLRHSQRCKVRHFFFHFRSFSNPRAHTFFGFFAFPGFFVPRLFLPTITNNQEKNHHRVHALCDTNYDYHRRIDKYETPTRIACGIGVASRHHGIIPENIRYQYGTGSNSQWKEILSNEIE